MILASEAALPLQPKQCLYGLIEIIIQFIYNRYAFLFSKYPVNFDKSNNVKFQ